MLRVLGVITRSPHGLIVCGPDTPVTIDVLAALSRATGYSVLGESLSHGRIQWGEHYGGLILGGYETFLRGELADALRPDVIIQTGALPVGSALLDYLGRQAQAHRILISETGRWADESLRIDEFIHADPLRILSNTEYHLTLIGDWREKMHIDPEWGRAFEQAEAITWHEIDALVNNEPVEGGILADVVAGLPDDSGLFIANSNPIRHFDQFVRPQHRRLTVLCNRGASGIDGTLASALGMAAAQETSALVIGDLALLHDLSSLHLVRRLNIPLVIVCINNDGGGIFHRLPIARHDPPFRDLFVTPHGLTFEHAAKMFDIPYTLSHMGGGFRAAFKAALEMGGPHLIEVPSDGAKFEQQRLRLIDTVAARIKDSGLIDKLRESQASPAEKAEETA